MARRGKAWNTARLGQAWRGKAWRGEAGQGKDLGESPERTGTQQQTRRNRAQMNSRTYQVTLTGESPLLLHRDNIQWGEAMKRWSSDPNNKKLSVAGDDRTPAHRWIGCLYVNAGLLVIDSDNLMTVLREGGAKCPAGKGNKTFKRETQSGIVVNEIGWPITVNGGVIPFAEIEALQTESDFEKHCATASRLGFSLFVKRARVNQTKHVRVRPRFDVWSVSGTLTVLDDTITTEVLERILTHAGAYAGLGDWRPSSPKSPGPFGRFTATIKEI